MPQTCTGTPGSAIVANCSVPKDGPTVPGPGGDFVTGAGLLAMMQGPCNDLATIRAGTWASSAAITLSGSLDIAQGRVITADGTGATIAGTWSATGPWSFGDGVAVRGGMTVGDGAVTFQNDAQVTFDAPPTIGASGTVNVLYASNTHPIILATTTPLVYVADGVQVDVTAVLGNTAANGTWVAIVAGLGIAPWAPASVYVSPTVVTANGTYWVAAGGGTSAPAGGGPTGGAVGSTFSDNGILWTNIGPTSTTGILALVGSKGSATYTSAGTVTTVANVIVGGTQSVRGLATSWNDGTVYTGSGGSPPTTSLVVQSYWHVSPDQGQWTAVTIAIGGAATTLGQGFGWEITPAECPQGSQLIAATVYFQPPSGHAGALSSTGTTNATIFRQARRPPASGGPTTTQIGATVFAPYGSAGAYEVYQGLTCPITAGNTVAGTEIVDHIRNRYYVVLETEDDVTNALSGTKVYSAECLSLVTSYAQP